MLKQLADSAEIVIVISAVDIEKNKMRGDLGITYDEDVLRLRTEFQHRGFLVGSVVITHYNGQNSADLYRQKLERLGIKAYYHYTIEGYPNNVALIDSEEGFGRNDYVQTTKPLVIVTAPGPGSGKMAVCLSQLYNEHARGREAGYAKFETFPVWNLPLMHPLNVAYEAATADLKDFNIIDSFHLDAYGITAVNYNRDMEMFPVVRRIIEKITGEESLYKSPTDMGVNQIAFAITDDEVVREASRQEVIRRYFKITGDFKRGEADEDACNRVKVLMERLGLKPEDRPPVLPARAYLGAAKQRLGQNEGITVVAIQMEDGTIITGRNSQLMTAPAAAVLNAVKYLAGIPDDMMLLPPIIIEPIQKMKRDVLRAKSQLLSSEEILLALSISAVTSPLAQSAVAKLKSLYALQAHSTTFISPPDEQTFSRLGISLTCDSQYLGESLFEG